jgi:hypothetical protein
MISSRNFKRWTYAAITFQLEECGGDGDCLFHCIAEALSRLLSSNITMESIRLRVATTLTHETLPAFLTAIQEDQHHKILYGSHELKDSHALSTVQAIVRTNGNTFQGTDVVLRWLVEKDQMFNQLRIGFIIFSTFGPGYTTIINEDYAENFILLFNHANTHWQLVNIVNEKQVCFSTVSKNVLNMIKQYL